MAEERAELQQQDKLVGTAKGLFFRYRPTIKAMWWLIVVCAIGYKYVTDYWSKIENAATMSDVQKANTEMVAHLKAWVNDSSDVSKDIEDIKSDQTETKRTVNRLVWRASSSSSTRVYGPEPFDGNK